MESAVLETRLRNCTYIPGNSVFTISIEYKITAELFKGSQFIRSELLDWLRSELGIWLRSLE